MKMKRLMMMAALSMGLETISAVPVADYQVVPLPQEITLKKGNPYLLTASTTICYTSANEQLGRNAQFLKQYIEEKTGLNVVTSTVQVKGAITLKQDPRVKDAEGYVIKVGEKGVTISGSTPAGVFYGIQTLRKSLPVLKGEAQVELPAAVITDAPRFHYRGMMLDCGRHYFPLSFVKEYIDLLALHNMNTFHWHLSEDQGWRIEIKKYPRLTEVGSVRKSTVIGRNSEVQDGEPYGGFYTQAEAREIVKYAAERYITVIPEIDMPGHMQAALASYPDMGCTGGPYEVATTWGVMSDVLCLGNEKTYEFCEDVLREIADIFPSKYIHIGGDEAPTRRWAVCPKCKKLAADHGLSIDKLQGYFTNRMEKVVNEMGHSIIGWDEILDGDINQSATIMSWRGAEPGQKGAKLGHDVIMTPTTHFYFDYYQTKDTWSEPLLIGGELPIEKSYSFEPIPAGTDPETAQHIIGVQANLWTEYIGNVHLAEYQVLPRMGALAEVQWTTAAKDFPAFKNRLKKLTEMYDLYGLTYAKHLWAKDKK